MLLRRPYPVRLAKRCKKVTIIQALDYIEEMIIGSRDRAYETIYNAMHLCTNMINYIKYTPTSAEENCLDACNRTKLLLLLLLLLLKEVCSARRREGDLHPNNQKTPAPQYQPIDRKKKKWKNSRRL